MPKFKPGDKVRCISIEAEKKYYSSLQGAGSPRIGDTYTVYTVGLITFRTIEYAPDGFYKGQYLYDDFILADAPGSFSAILGALDAD